MSLTKKRSLWQKIKRLLSVSDPQSVADRTDVYKSSPQVNIYDENNIDSHLDTDNKNHANSASADDAKLADSNDTQDDNLESTNAQSIAADSNASKNNDDTPIVNYLKEYLQDKQWHYTYYRPKSSDSQQSHHLSLRMKNKQIDCGYLFRVQEGNSLLAVYGILPFLIPESHQSAAMLLITQVNYDMLIGNLEMDVNDGEIRYKNAIDVDAVGIDEYIIEHLLQSVIAMTTVAYEVFSDLINTQDPTEDMPTLLGELRQQADARTFFLPTQFVQ
ncbi:YbjN domain-containing protein [Psychrobacter urativorans]|uniref:YbjN domain-containing protein n=1 Tax=Psychrobacter urativorans TaxID=45610 RepID=UPI001917AA66|nr:YbjN domain-containing protein [Psychrobacter urativorans]